MNMHYLVIRSMRYNLFKRDTDGHYGVWEPNTCAYVLESLDGVRQIMAMYRELKSHRNVRFDLHPYVGQPAIV